MDTQNLIAFAAPIALLLGGLLGAALNRWFSDSHGEWKELALVREEANTELRQRVADLERQVSHLQGQFDALAELKTMDIADRVILGLMEKRVTVG